MAELDKLVKKYYLDLDTHKVLPKETGEELLNLVTHEEYWQNIFKLCGNNVLLKDFFIPLPIDEKEKYLKFGISCFVCFIQANYTGPKVSKTVDEFLDREMFKNTDFASRLAMSGEEINENAKYPALLVVAETIFDCCFIDHLVNLWWCCRALIAHQDMLDELSPTLLLNADRLYKLIQNVAIEGEMKAKLDIELAQLYLKFRNVSKAKVHITSASEVLGVRCGYTGMLGKRTKHQVKEIAQLTLLVTVEEKEGIERPEVEKMIIPQSLGLDDDVRLDQIKFSEDTKCTRLSNTDQKLFLTRVQLSLMSSPTDELYIEEILPQLDLILSQNNTYAVRLMALLVRCKLESHHKRTIERCLKNCEDIINSVKQEDVHVLNRFGDVFGVALPPVFRVEAQYADMMLNFGLVKNSLEIYLKVKLWEEVIVCYTILSLKHKAAEVIRAQMEVKPSVKLMCLLGDSTDDVSCYEKAWNMSHRRSHRAQRHWGQYHFVRKQYADCIPHYEKSLSINPLQSTIWLRLGFAALQEKNWQTAATAYRRYTNLEPEGFEAWNNLAQVYIKLGNKRSAHQALLEALRCKYDNWKVWQNFLVVSCDIANFSDVIRAYHRLLDLKEKFLDVDVLSILVYSVCNDVNGNDEAPGNKCLQKTRELVGRVTALFPGNGTVWELYASLAPVLLLRTQRLQRAFRGYTQTGWDRDLKTCFKVLNICLKLAGIVLSDEIDSTSIILNSIKLSLSSAVTAVKKQNWDEPETKALLQDVIIQLEKVVDKVNTANAAFQVE